jgi:hypothetical protein
MILGVEKLKSWPFWGVLIFFCAAGLLAFWFKNVSRWPDYRRLAHGGRATMGWVTAKGLNGKQRVNYSFTVDGRVYSGLGRAGFGTPEFPNLNKGDDVLVFYLTQDPEVSVLGDPGEHLRQQNRVLAFVLTFIAIIAFVVIRRELHRGVGEDGFSSLRI